MELNSCAKCARGQIWFWEDPIYGDKRDANNYGIIGNDSITHFSRYVLVVQNSETMSGGECLVAPISSSNNGKFAVPVSIHGHLAYILLNKIFPASAKSLRKYVSVLKVDKMRKVDTLCSYLLFNTDCIDLLDKVSDIISEFNAEAYDEPTSIPEKKVIRSKPFAIVQRKTRKSYKRIEYTDDVLIKMVDIINKEGGIDAAAKAFGVSKSTIRRYYNGENGNKHMQEVIEKRIKEIEKEAARLKLVAD